MNKYHNHDQRDASDSFNEEQLDRKSIRYGERGESTLNYVLAGVIGAAVAVVLIVAGGGAVYMMTSEKGSTTSNDSVQPEGAASTKGESNKQLAEASSSDKESDKPSKDARERDRIISWLNSDAEKILSIWEDRYETALNVSRMALADPVSKLKSTRRKWQNLDHPDSLDKFHQWKTRELNWIITGFETFMARKKIGEFDLEIGKYVGQAADKILINTLQEKQIDPSKVTVETKDPNQITTKKYVKAFKDVYSNEFMQKVMQFQGYDIQKRLDTIRQTNEVLGVQFNVDSTFGGSDGREKVKKKKDKASVATWLKESAQPLIQNWRKKKEAIKPKTFSDSDLTNLKNIRAKWKKLSPPTELESYHKWVQNQFSHSIKGYDKVLELHQNAGNDEDLDSEKKELVDKFVKTFVRLHFATTKGSKMLARKELQQIVDDGGIKQSKLPLSTKIKDRKTIIENMSMVQNKTNTILNSNSGIQLVGDDSLKKLKNDAGKIRSELKDYSTKGKTAPASKNQDKTTNQQEKNDSKSNIENSIGEKEAKKKLDQQGIEYSKSTYLKNVRSGNHEVVELFLIAGMDTNINEDNFRNTPLMIASARGHAKVVKSLLNHGADPSVKTSSGDTALDFASLQGYDKIVGMLKEKLGKSKTSKEEKDSNKDSNVPGPDTQSSWTEASDIPAEHKKKLRQKGNEIWSSFSKKTKVDLLRELLIGEGYKSELKSQIESFGAYKHIPSKMKTVFVASAMNKWFKKPDIQSKVKEGKKYAKKMYYDIWSYDERNSYESLPKDQLMHVLETNYSNYGRSIYGRSFDLDDPITEIGFMSYMLQKFNY